VSRRAVWAIAALAAAALAGGCAGDLVEEWQLDHDRIVAVRATPPAIPAGGQAKLDGLIAAKGGRVSERGPEVAIVVSPMSLGGAVAFDGASWVVTAPADAALAAARAELGLDAGARVPLVVGVAYNGQTLGATKTVWLGAAGANPVLEAMLIDGAPAATRAELVVPRLIDVPLSVAAGVDDDVTWLSSVGEVIDFDLAEARLRVEEGDPTEGELAVVRRDPDGGVVWQVWPIRAE
jgi:hypothetical protein